MTIDIKLKIERQKLFNPDFFYSMYIMLKDGSSTGNFWLNFTATLPPKNEDYFMLKIVESTRISSFTGNCFERIITAKGSI